MTLQQLSQIPLLSYSTLREQAANMPLKQLQCTITLLYNKRYIEQDIDYEQAHRVYTSTLICLQNKLDRLDKKYYI